MQFDQVNEKEYLDFITEWENNPGKIVPGAINRKKRTFSEMMKKWADEEANVTEGFVPATLYFLKDNKNKLLGAIHFRHRLNDRLKINGGHIGYGVRPSERRKGYATIMLMKLLEIIKKAKLINNALITCDDDNIGSIKTIENNRGILQDKIEFEGALTRRYWIDLEES